MPLLKKLIKARFGTAGRLADALGVHRNSVSSYLSGKELLPHTLEKMLHGLGASSLDVFVPVVSNDLLKTQQALAGAIEHLVKRCPEASIVLFGSRARDKNRKYSDVDIGVLKRAPLSLKEWSDLRNIVDEQTEDLPFQIDLVDLARADGDFLRRVARDAKFLGGSPKQYLELTRERS